MAQDWGTFHVNQDGQDGGRRDLEVRPLRCQMFASFVFTELVIPGCRMYIRPAVLPPFAT
jgi:hypothetical protein